MYKLVLLPLAQNNNENPRKKIFTEKRILTVEEPNWK